MNNTPSLNEINKNSNMNPNMLTKNYKLKLMNDFMTTIQRYRNDINMISPYRINPNNLKKQQKKTKIGNNDDLKRPQLTLNELKTTSNDKKTKSKNILKAGSIQEDNIEINEHYLDKIIKNN